MSIIGNSLVALQTNRDEITPILLDTIVVHADVLNLNFIQRIRGDGRAAGASSVANLGKACSRVRKRCGTDGEDPGQLIAG